MEWDRSRRTLELGDLHTLAALVATDKRETGLLDLLHVRRVDLVAVAVALPDNIGIGVELAHGRPLRVGLEHGRPQSEAHRAAEVRLRDLGHEDDDGIGGGLKELGRVRICEGSVSD